MNRSSDLVPSRMPGSAIIAVVLLGLQALVGLVTGIALNSLIPQGLAVLLVMGGILNAALAVGVAMRHNWARVTGLVLSGIAIGATVIGFLISAAEGTPIGNPGALGISIGLFALLAHKNTRAWCNGREAAVFGPLDDADEPFKRHDRVELVDGVEEAGLPANAVGTVIELPATPRTVVVEFDDHPDREPVQVTLHVDEIRPVAEAD
jgi:hypothetical protein